jgi:ribonucleoside-diphosphate reductase beta chain
MYQNGNDKQRWIASKIDLSRDRFDLLTRAEQTMVENIIAFFSNADGMVNDNIADLLRTEFDLQELNFWYGLQTVQEQVHNELYGLFILKYIPDKQKQISMFNSLDTNPLIANKCKWFDKWIGKGTKAHKLVGLALSEGLLFSSLFASVFYFRNDNKLKGFVEGNDYVSKDEASHYQMSVYVYHNILKDYEKLSKEELKQIVLECYELEKEYVLQAIPNGLIGLNSNLMLQYVQYVVDVILTDFGLDKVFYVNQPLAYMEQLAINAKNNFFETKTAEYQRASNNEYLEYTDNF